MKTSYLRDYKNYDIAYLPVGTFEWHGNHLPLETDVIVAETIANKISQQIPGYVMPGIYLGTDKRQGELRGMERHLNKRLFGEIYYLDWDLLYQVFDSVIKNLVRDGFKKVVVITGHGGSKQVEILEKIEASNSEVIFLRPFKLLSEEVVHAGNIETSVLWACRPEEEAISRAMKIPKDDDYISWYGKDPRTDASFERGKKCLEEMIEKGIQIVNEGKKFRLI